MGGILSTLTIRFCGCPSIVKSAEQTRAGVRYKPPKSGKGRTVALPSMAGEELRADRLRQAEALLKLRIRLSDDTFVAVQADGSFTSREGMDCRASACVHGKIVQERLGHASISTTLNIYSHVVEGCRRPPSGSMRR